MRSPLKRKKYVANDGGELDGEVDEEHEKEESEDLMEEVLHVTATPK